MRHHARPGISTPDSPGADMSDDGSGASFRRILVPVESFRASTNALSLAARMGHATGGPLRLVYVRMWDPPVRRGGIWFSETSEDATAILDTAMGYVWARDVEASGIVVEAPRSSVGAAIIAEASRWGADVIVFSAHPRRVITLGAWDKATRQVTHAAPCPLLLVYPRRP